MDKESKLLKVRKEKITELSDSGIHLYPNTFKPTVTISELQKKTETDEDALGETGLTFKAAGRMMAINKMGKSSFSVLKMVLVRYRSTCSEKSGG
jgi:lysyl-tRNA synthetase class 2